MSIYNRFNPLGKSSAKDPDVDYSDKEFVIEVSTAVNSSNDTEKNLVNFVINETYDSEISQYCSVISKPFSIDWVELTLQLSAIRLICKS